MFEKADGETEGCNMCQRRNMCIVNQYYTVHELEPGLPGQREEAHSMCHVASRDVCAFNYQQVSPAVYINQLNFFFVFSH